MHPSEDIVGTKSDELRGRRVVVGVTGSVAAVRSVDLVRELMRRGAEVKVVMTDAASRLVTPQLLHWASGREVVCSLTGEVEHVKLAKWGDLVLVAPTTANTLSKIACAIDDTPVTSVVSVALGMRKPVVVAPAMHHSMYEHPLLKENLQRLRSAGIHLIDPVLEEGKAKLPSVERIADFVTSLLTPHDMEGLKVLITAGPTIEPIDPIKRITNPSSGKMGFAFAKIAVNRGAAATVIYGPGTETPSPGMKVIRVQTTEEMKRAFDRELLEQPDIIVSAAAPQDFVVESPSPRKLRHDQEFTLKLKPAPRILDGARERAPRAFIVGFKAEHGVSDEELESAARMKLAEHKLDLVVANDVARPEVGFGTETSEVVLVGQNYTKRLRGSKERIAREVFDLAIKKLGRRGAERMFSREAFRGAP